MSNGYNYLAYHARMTEKECIKRLDNLLKAIKEDYNFLWEGNPSLIFKYGLDDVTASIVDSNKQLSLSRNLPDTRGSGFESIGIIKKDNKFNFYLEPLSLTKKPLIGDADKVYNLLEKQFILNTKYCMDEWAKSIHKEIKDILEKDMTEKLDGLKKKLEI